MPTETTPSGWIAIATGAVASFIAVLKIWPKISKDIGQKAIELKGVVEGQTERLLDRQEKQINFLLESNQALRVEIDTLRVCLFETNVRHSADLEAARAERDAARDEVEELRKEVADLRRQVLKR